MTETEYWEYRYSSGGNSGYGSYGEQLEKKLKWLSGLEINSIAEVGCGDFNFGSSLMEMYPHATYAGVDVSQDIVNKNKEKWPQYSFDTTQEVPEADLLLCVDVVFHVLDDKRLEDLLDRLEKAKCKYFAITAYEEDLPEPGSHVRLRKFDYKRFGEPIIREIVEEDGSLYFYLYDRSKRS